MMNMQKEKHFAVLTLILTGLSAALGWSAAAHAQKLEFAQKSFGNVQSTMDNTQFKSTIIDPSRSGKSTTTNSTLRVIPITQAGTSQHDYACSICGVVESINITLYEGSGGSDEDEVEHVSRGASAKGNGYVLLTKTISEAIGRYAKAQQKPASVYEVKVRMSDGTFRIVNEFHQPDYAVGDYVRVISGAVTVA